MASKKAARARPARRPRFPRIRFHCLVNPGPGPHLGFDHLAAIDSTGIGVRAVPIGLAILTADPWSALEHCFRGPPPDDGEYVNIVCAPPRYSLGTQATRAAIAPPTVVPPGMRVPALPGDEDEIVYRPMTALAGLYTVGVPNIAITMPQPKPTDDEIGALGRYDRVFTPNAEAARRLGELGIKALVFRPHAGAWKRLLQPMIPKRKYVTGPR